MDWQALNVSLLLAALTAPNPDAHRNSGRAQAGLDAQPVAQFRPGPGCAAIDIAADRIGLLPDDKPGRTVTYRQVV